MKWDHWQYQAQPVEWVSAVWQRMQLENEVGRGKTPPGGR